MVLAFVVLIIVASMIPWADVIQRAILLIAGFGSFVGSVGAVAESIDPYGSSGEARVLAWIATLCSIFLLVVLSVVGGDIAWPVMICPWLA